MLLASVLQLGATRSVTRAVVTAARRSNAGGVIGCTRCIHRKSSGGATRQSPLRLSGRGMAPPPILGAHGPAHVRSFSSSVRAHAAGGRAATGVVDYLLADVGEGITECEIVKWFVEPGAHVEEFDILVEVQSDKASVEITSRYTGTVVEHCYQVGQVARVGSPLCRISVQGKEGEEGEEEAAAAPKEEQTVKETDEAASSPAQSTTTAPAKEAERDHAKEARHERNRTLATPAVRRLTRENAIEIADVRGTGRDGRVTKEDVQLHLDSVKAGASSDVSDKSTPAPAATTSTTATTTTTTTIPLSGVRKAMFKAMSATWTAPHFGYSEEIDVTQLDSIRRQWNKTSAYALPSSAFSAVGTSADSESTAAREKLTLLPFLLKALSLALHGHPIFRSTLNGGAMELTQTEEHRMSIAFASSKGLVTPTLRGDVRQLSVLDIARQVHALQQSGATRGLSKEQLGSGATVTLSNIGSVGGTHTFPLIPPTGQLVIGAMGRARTLPRFDDDGNVVKASILPVSFSADHRVVEGVELARFVDDWKRLIEHPTSWLLAMR